MWMCCPGHVILGSVDGNRIWAKDLRNTQLTHLEVKSHSLSQYIALSLLFTSVISCVCIFTLKLKHWGGPDGIEA